MTPLAGTIQPRLCAPDMSDPASALAEGLAALQRRDFAGAVSALREAAAAAPEAMEWHALAQAELGLGRNDAAEDALDRQLETAPRDIGALLMKGLLRERGGDARAATSFFQSGLAQARAEGGVPPPLAQLATHAQGAIGRAERDFTAHLIEGLGEVSPAVAEAIELLTGERRLYLQEPNVFYYPGLPQRRFYEVEEFPWLPGMLALLPAMQAELAGVLDHGVDGFAPYVRRQDNRPAPNNPLLDKQDWSAFHFWQDGAIDEANAARCPATMAALELAPMPRIPRRSPNAHWSRLLPGAHIAPHHGMLNTRLICHIPILTAPGCSLRVGSETRGWADGLPLIFDDSFEHEARNAGPQPRVVLLFEIWRPELPEEDRDAIGRIFQSIGSYGQS